jgi:hypothetical protein
MRYPKRTQYKYAKSQYRVRNWADYETGLRRRGALTVWLSDTALKAWRAPATGRPGGQRTYSDLAIEAAQTIRLVFHLPLRQTEGFLRSLGEVLGLGLPIPDHTTLSRRLQGLGNLQTRELAGDDPIHLLIDSTGLRVHVGHLRKPPKRRVWRKLHLAVNADTGEVLASDLTNRRTADCARVPELLDQIDDEVASLTADGAYDAGAVYEAAQEKGNGNRVSVLIPPGRGAQPSSIRSPGQRERNRNVRSMRKDGRKEWYASSGYSRRSLVENAVFRYKTILGHRMRSRSLGSQRVEVKLACRILNRMARLGMPDSVKVE